MKSTNPALAYQRQYYTEYGSSAPYILQYENVAVAYAGTWQSGVQSVSVKAGTGLTFLRGPLSKSGTPISKARDITVDITYAGGGFASPAGANSFATIDIAELGQKTAPDGAYTQGPNSIHIPKAILIGTSSSIRAGSFGTTTYTYRALGYHTDDSRTPAHPADAISNGSTGIWGCFTTYADAVGYESSVKINRKFLYNKGSAAPYALLIEYPIVTTEAITYIGAKTTLSEILKKLSCDNVSQSSLESITHAGAQAGTDSSFQHYTYNFKNEGDYGLSRYVSITT